MTETREQPIDQNDDNDEVIPGAWLKKEIARKTAELEAKGDPLAVYHGIVRSIFG